MITSLINLLTFARIIIGVIIFGFLALKNYYFLSLALFFIAGITDYLDGFFARKYKVVSNFSEN